MTTLVVAAAVLIEGDKVLLTQRKAGSHLALSWEFPGGKVDNEEDPRDALTRELREELGIEAIADEVVEVTFHRYPERAVLLLFFAAHRAPGSPDPRALDTRDFRWAKATELDPALFPPADLAVLQKVRALMGGANDGGARELKDETPRP